jgi:ATP-dependent Clp protease ATP-binding subunit ClpA
MSMWEPFQESLRRAIVLAQSEAMRLGSNHIGTEHLLLGIIAEGESRASKLLPEWGITLAPSREVAGELASPQGRTSNEMAFTANAKKTIEISFAVAREAKHNYVSPEHMLVAMTRQHSGGARTIFERLVGQEKLSEFFDAALLEVRSTPAPDVASGTPPQRVHVSSVGRGSARDDARMALYTECLHAASVALGPGVEMETVRAKAKALFDGAIADVAAAGGEAPPQN